MIPYFGASVYDDPAVYCQKLRHQLHQTGEDPHPGRRRRSRRRMPRAAVVRVLACAQRDERVPTELVVYPNEGHRFVSAEHRRDVMERAVEWFEQYMPEKP